MDVCEHLHPDDAPTKCQECEAAGMAWREAHAMTLFPETLRGYSDLGCTLTFRIIDGGVVMEVSRNAEA